MVIKRTNQSGGYGMVMGNKAEEKELDDVKKSDHRNTKRIYCPTDHKLSTVPCLIDGNCSHDMLISGPTLYADQMA